MGQGKFNWKYLCAPFSQHQLPVCYLAYVVPNLSYRQHPTLFAWERPTQNSLPFHMGNMGLCLGLESSSERYVCADCQVECHCVALRVFQSLSILQRHFFARGINTNHIVMSWKHREPDMQRLLTVYCHSFKERKTFDFDNLIHTDFHGTQVLPSCCAPRKHKHNTLWKSVPKILCNVLSQFINFKWIPTCY